LYCDRARIDELLSKGHQRRGASRHAG
jgi:hypothetical protein